MNDQDVLAFFCNGYVLALISANPPFLWGVPSVLLFDWSIHLTSVNLFSQPISNSGSSGEVESIPADVHPGQVASHRANAQRQAFTLTSMPAADLDSQVNTTSALWTVRGRPQAKRKRENKPPLTRRFKPRTSLLWGTRAARQQRASLRSVPSIIFAACRISTEGVTVTSRFWWRQVAILPSNENGAVIISGHQGMCSFQSIGARLLRCCWTAAFLHTF